MKSNVKFLVMIAVFSSAALFLFGSGTKELELTEADKEAGWRFFSPIGFKLKRPAFFDTDGKNIEVNLLGDEDKKTDEALYQSYSYMFFSDELDMEYTAISQNNKLTEEEKNEKINSEVLSKLKPLYALVVLRTPLIRNTQLKELTAYPYNTVIRQTSEFTQVFAFTDFDPAGLSEASAALYKKMIAQVRPIIPSITCIDPVSAEAAMMKVKQLVFETADLNGNRVTSDIFKNYDVTMVNLWATWCPPCKAELPELAKLYELFKEKNCNVLGITGDVSLEDQHALELAKTLTEKAKCGYTIVQNHTSLDALFKKVSAWPTTIFVDKNGSIIASSVNDVLIGSRGLEEFSKAMQNALDTVKNNGH